jgi:choline dehydrogenase-like flavoprotein
VSAPHEATCLTTAEREALVRVAQIVMPPGRTLPGAGAPAVEKYERFLAERPAAARVGLRSLVWMLEAASLARYRRRFARLDDARGLALLEGLRRRGGYPVRLALRALTAPLKVAHFDDPGIFRALGCRWGVEPPAAEPTPRWFERVTRGRDLGAAEELEADVVVIGTGAGGAVAAKELAERGVAVVMLEEGAYFRRADFTGHAVDMQFRLYRDGGATFTCGNVGIPVATGMTVGGTTTVNSGTCYRAPERVLTAWRGELGLDDLGVAGLAPYYERVERTLEVAPAAAKHLGGCARVVARGCDALGFHHRPLRRNAPDCDGQGLCCFGCPTDAKRSTNVSYVPLALRAGAQLVTEVRAERILVAGGRAVGVAARAPAGRLTVRARAVVVACGALLTPVLLERNGLCRASGQVGRNLSIHPALGLYALFDESIGGASAIPQGYAIEEFHEEGLLFEGAFVPPDYGSGAVTLLGRRFMDLMEAYDRIAGFGFMIEDTSRGRVRAMPGSYRPFITYNVNDADVARLKRGVDVLSRVFLAAGARTVVPNVHGFDEIRDEAELAAFRRAPLRARDFELMAYHPLGTARIGRDPRTSVVGPDHEAHDVPGLYVVDGAAVPTSLGVNPQLTIMALATRAAERLAAKLEGQGPSTPPSAGATGAAITVRKPAFSGWKPSLEPLRPSSERSP